MNSGVKHFNVCSFDSLLFMQYCLHLNGYSGYSVRNPHVYSLTFTVSVTPHWVCVCVWCCVCVWGGVRVCVVCGVSVVPVLVCGVSVVPVLVCVCVCYCKAPSAPTLCDRWAL